MQPHQLTITHPEFSVKITESKRTKLGQREEMQTGGITVNLADIPPAVLNSLLIKAVTDHVRAGLKKLDQGTVTKDAVLAAMNSQVEVLKAGVVAGTKAKGATKNIRAAARSLLRKSLQDAMPVEVDSKKLTKVVSDLFASYDKWFAAKDPAKRQQYEKDALVVKRAIDTATQQEKEQSELTAALVAGIRSGGDTGPTTGPTTPAKAKPTPAAKAKPAPSKAKAPTEAPAASGPSA